MENEFKPRRYACIKWPFLRIGSKVHFEGGFFTAQDEDQVSAIENNQAFGIHIHPIKWEPKPVPTRPTKIEEMIEEEVANAIAKENPRVRRGAIGTR